jgi:hypothetical protein
VHVAIEHITVEYRTASFFFAIAITCFHFAVVVYVWGSGPPLATKVMLTCLAAYSLFQIAKYSIDTSKQFWVEKVHAHRAQARRGARMLRRAAHGARSTPCTRALTRGPADAAQHDARSLARSLARFAQAYTGAFSDEPVPSRPPRPAGDTGKSPQPAPQPATHLFNAAAIRSDACGSPGPAGFGAAPTIVPRSYSSADFAHGPDGTVPRSLSQGWMPESCERISQLSTSVAASAVARGSGAATAAASSISALSSILRARTKSGTHPPPADASGGSVRAGASRAGSSCTSPAPGAATSALGSPAQAARLGAGDHAAATGASGAQTAAGPRDAGAGGTMY